MDNYKKRMQVMAYLTRKPVTPQDIEIAQSRILKPVTPLQVQATSIEKPETDYQTEVAPEMVVPPQDVLPKNAEPVMPWSQGIPNPQARQLELATGGVVNREGFNDGTNLRKKTLEEILKKGSLKNFKGTPEQLAKYATRYIEKYAEGNRNVAADQLNYSKNEKNNAFTRALIKKGVDNTQLPSQGRTTAAPRFTKKEIDSPITGEAAKLKGNDLMKWIKKQNELKNYDDINFYKAIEKYKNEELGGNLYKFWEESGLSRSNIEKSFARRRGFQFTTLGKDYLKDRIANQLNLIKNNKEVLDFIKNQDFRPEEIKKISKKVGTIIGTNSGIGARRIADLSDAIHGDEDYIKIKVKDKDILEGARKISDIKERNVFRDFGSIFKRIDAERNVSKQLNEKPSFMNTARGYITSYLPEGMSTDEIKNIASSAKYTSGGYSALLQGIEGDINYYTKSPVDTSVENAEKQLQNINPDDPEYDQERERIKNKYNKKVEEFTKEVNQNLKKGELPVRAFKLSFDPPSESVANYENLPKNIKKNINNLYNNYGYSFEVPKDIMDVYAAKEYVKSPEGQASMEQRSKAGHNRVFFEALDVNSPLRKAIGYFPGTAVPLTLFDAVTLPLAGYSIPETATIAAQNLLKNPYIAGAANLVTQGYMTSKEATDKTMMDLANERRETLEQGITNAGEKIKEFFKTKQEEIPSYSESSSYAIGGRVKLKNGTDETYNPEIPSLGETDPIGILEQRLLNSKDINEIMKLLEIIKQAKEEKAAEQKVKEEYKIAQKEKGIRYKEDFPSEAAYFAETGKQLLTNPKYFLGKAAKGAIEGTEWLVGQPMKTLFSQEGKNWELYHPVAGEKLGLNKYIEENIPKGATTGTLLAGDVAEIAGTFLDPFLAYGIIKGATTTAKTKAPIAIEEKIDPTRRDILKTGAVLTGGAIVYPTAKKLGLLDAGVKATKTANAVRVATHHVVDNMPEFFPYLSEFSRRKGKIIGQDYMRSGMTEFKREITIPLELNTIGGGKTNVKFEFIHNPAEGNVTAYYTNPLTDEKHMFDFYTGQQGRQRYGIDPEIPNASELYTVEIEPPGFYYKSPNKADPYRKDYEYYDTATEGDDVIKALDKWYKGLSKEEKAKFENKFVTHSEYADELPSASYENTDENYPIMDFMYPKKKND